MLARHSPLATHHCRTAALLARHSPLATRHCREAAVLARLSPLATSHCLAAAVGVALAGCFGLVAGCHLSPVRGAVSRSLIQSRQLSQQGQSALERQDWLRAEVLLAKAVAACDVDPDARHYHAEALWNLGDQESALAEMRHAVRLADHDSLLRARLAEMELDAGRVDAAGQGVQQAIDMDPTQPTAWAMRGRVFAASGDLRRALADYQRALAYQPDDRELLLAIAELYRELNLPARALANLQQLADTYPPGEEPQQVLYLQGLALAALDRHADAVDAFVSARERGPANSDLLCRLAEAELLAGRVLEARQTVAMALATEPSHAESLALRDRLENRQR